MKKNQKHQQSNSSTSLKSIAVKLIAAIMVLTFLLGQAAVSRTVIADDSSGGGEVATEQTETAPLPDDSGFSEPSYPVEDYSASEEESWDSSYDYSEPITDTGEAVDVSTHPLVEVEASDDEPLLSLDELDVGTQALIEAGPAKLEVKKSKSGRRLLAKSADSNDDTPTEGPISDDGKTIEWVTVEWLSHSTGSDEPAGKGTLELETDSATVGNQQFQINFALSGTDDHEPGSVEITIPAYIWHDRYRNEPGELTLSVPEEPGIGADFAWRRVGDNIVITNLRRLSAASKVMIQGTYRNVKPYDMVDKDVSPESAYANAENLGHSNPFSATIGITTPNDKYIALKSNEIDATIDTHVSAASATKSAYNTSNRSYYVYHTVEKATALDGGNMPAEFLTAMRSAGLNPDEYSYARWYVSGSATGSQPFLMTVNDTYNGTIIHYLDSQHQQTETLQVEGRLIGVQGALVLDEESGEYKTGNVLSEDGTNVTATIYDGYNTLPKSAYVWTAYKKSDFPVEGDEYRISNTQTVEVTGWDDLVTTTKEATAEAPFRLPVTYHVKKVWNDKGHEDRRPDHQSFGRYYNENLNTLETITVTPKNDWTYTWDDEGQGWQYKVREYGMTSSGTDITGRYNFMNIPDEEYVHIINQQYDEDGDLREYDRWWYELEREEYDSETHTWIKYNKYCEEHVVRSLVPFREQKLEVGIRKTRNNYWDSNLMSTSDRALNVLRRGDDVIVGYNVYGYGYIMELTKGQDVENVDITSFGFRDVKLELEDNYGEDTLKDAKDNTLLLDSSIRLTPDDAEVAYVSLTTPTYLHYYQPDKYSPWTMRTLTAADFGDFDRPDEELWGCDAEGNWTRYAVMSIDNNGTLNVTTENGATKGGSQTYINLPEGVWKVKTVMTVPGLKDHEPETLDRRIDGVRMSYNIGIRLKGNSETIQNRLNALFDANDYAMCTLDNYATINVTEQDEEGFATSLDDQSRTWLHGRNHRVAVRQEKNFELVENDLSKRQLKLHSTVTMTQQSNILEQNEYWDARSEGLIPSTASGTWYDLLPLGVMPDVESVKLSNGADKITDVYTIENYKGSGRVLLVVKAEVEPHVSYTHTYDPNPYKNDITYPKEGYKDVHTFEFDAYYSWDEARLYGVGTNVRNVAAYEADEKALGNINGWAGEPDNPTTNHNQRAMDAVGNDKDLMTGLDPERTDEHTAFVYSGSILKHEEIDFMAATELRKYVTRDGLGIWTTGRAGQTQATVYEGDYYTYMLYVASDSSTVTKNIILLDSLETYIPNETGEDEEDNNRGRWQGLFNSVDVSGLRALGIKPVVYYNTAPQDLAALKGGDSSAGSVVIPDGEMVYKYLQDPKNGWTTELPSDPSTVKAIAVDIRKNADGTDFELQPSSNIYCTVRMRAKIYETSGEESDPFNEDEEARKHAENNDYAFNNVFLGCTNVDPAGQKTHAVINYNYVRVGILPFELKVTKVWDDANNTDGKRPNEIKVHLLANGKRMDPDQTITLNKANDWTGVFAHVIRYDDDGNWINYSFEEESTDPNPAFNLDGYEQRTERQGENVTLTNKHTPEKTQISFTKTWEDQDNENGERPESITVRLMADGVFTGKTIIVKPDRSGNWAGSFTDLPKYTNPEGLSGAQHEIEYSVEEVPVYKYIDEYDTDQETRTITINNKYYPFGNLFVQKNIVNATAVSEDKEFTFTLLLKDQEGNELTEKFKYTIQTAQKEEGDESQIISSGSIGNGDTFTLKGNENIVIADIPSETSYEVIESETPGYTLISSSNASGSIRAGGAVQFSYFTNRYEASGSQSLSLFKTLEGRDMSRYQFRFELVDKTEDSETYDQVIRTASADADGNAMFSRLMYTEADHGKTFTYQIQEVDREKPGYTYDKNTYMVKVAVTDNGDGTMTCTPTYYKADGTVIENPVDPKNDIVFHNIYKAKGSIALKAWKQLPDGELKDYLPFEFELLQVNTDPESESYKQGALLQTKPCDIAGTIAFDVLNFTEKDVGKTFLYVIREKEGTDARVIYDEQLRGIELSVADNGDGTLAITQTNVTITAEEQDGTVIYEKGSETTELPVFVNHLEPGNLSVTKLTKWEDKEPDGNAEFPFSLTLVGDELPETITVVKAEGDSRQKSYSVNPPDQLTADEKQEKEVELTITSPENVTPVTGVYEFTLKAGQTLTVKDLPAGVAYQFQETIPPGWTLEFENVAGIVVPQATTAATYTNTYEPGNTVVTILATKRLDGSTPPAQKFAFELVDDTDGSDTKGDVLQTLWNHASGYVLFDLKYSEKGTYHYILREVQGLVESVDSEGNITYSTNEDELRKIEFDENTYGVTVNVDEIVDEAGNKTLTARVTYDENNNTPPQFKNTTRPGSLQISKVGTGLTDANKDKEFKFKVTLSNDAGMPLTESGNMIWYAQKSDEQAPVAPIPETPEQPENSEPAEIEQTQSVQDPATGRNLMAVRQQLKAAPLSAPLLGAEPSLEDEHGGIDKTGVYGGGNQTVNGIQHGTVTYTLYKDGYLFLKPTNGVSGTFNNSSNPDKSYVASHTKYMVVEETCYAVGTVQDMICSADNIVYADLRGMDVSHATNLVDFLDWSSKLEYLDISTWAVPTNYGGRFLYRSGSLSVIKIGPEFRASSSAFFASPGGNWTCLEKPKLGTKTIAELCNGNKAGETYAGTWVREGYNANFTIAFDPNGATGNMEPIDASIADPPNLPKCTFESELNFAGWSTDPNAIVPEYEDEAEFTGAALGGQTITLYAIWMSKDSFLLNYDANGGYSRVQWQRVNGPTATVEMPVPSHPNNYEFLYWTTQADGGGDRYSGTVSGADFNATPGSTIKLYAQYLDPDQRARVTVEHYQQNANLLGYTLSGTDHLGAFDLGATVTPEKKDYKGFIPPTSYTVVAGGSTTTQDDGTDVTAVKGGVVVRYYYDRTKYKLAFDANGGTGTMSEMNMLGGVPAKLPVNRFTKENAIFVGWNTKPDGSGTSYGDGQSVNSIGQNGETVTLYAQWFDLDDAQSAEATNGEYIVTCKANETIVFPTLPAGTHYTIEEINLPDGWTLKGIDNNSGTVLSAERVNVTATNQYSATGYADIIAHKALPGETVSEGQFTFELLDENGTVLQTKSNSPTDTMEQTYDNEGNPVPNSYYGTAPVLFDTITYNQQGVYHYQIRETKGTDSAITYDAHIENVTVVVKDRGDGRLVTEVLYDESGANFRNDMSPGNLTVSKTVRNASTLAAEKSFTFTVYLFDRNGDEIQDAYPVKLSNGDETTVKSGGAVSIKGDESFTVEGLPHQSRYIVVEVPTDGFELAKKDGDEGTIQAGETSKASFENAYSSRTNAEGGAVIEAKKVFEHGVIQPEQFKFRLSDSSNEEIETVYANPDGSVEFSPLHYTLEDDGKRFVYYIEEVPGEDSGIVYDTHRERVSVTVTDNGDGTMTTEVTYDGETAEEAKEPPTFINQKKGKSISISKKLAQKDSSSNAPHKAEKNLTFEFLVYEGEPVEGLFNPDELSNAEVAELLADRKYIYVPLTVKKGESEASADLWNTGCAYTYDADKDRFIEDPDSTWEWIFDGSYSVIELPNDYEDYELKQLQLDQTTIPANNQSFINKLDIDNQITVTNEYQKDEPPTDGIATGDHSNALPYLIGALGALVLALTTLLIRSRRRKKR